MSEEILNIKIVLIGEARVGKSCILQRYTRDVFEESGAPTLGVSFLSKKLIIKKQPLKLNIWDTAGQERFSSLTKLYSRDAQIVVFVYDITSKTTFERMKIWHQTLKHEGFDENVVYAVVGNKEDLVEEEEVPLSEAKSFAESLGACYYKTSAKFNQGIDEMFIGVCEKYVTRSSYVESNNINLSEVGPKRKKTCCN